MPLPDWVRVIFAVELPFKPACWTAQLPVRLGGAAEAAVIDDAAIAKPQKSDRTKRFKLLSL